MYSQILSLNGQQSYSLPTDYKDQLHLWILDPNLYTTGTITATNGSPIITGLGTAWLTNVQVGDRIGIGSSDTSSVTSVYTVLTVDLDTQITLTTNFTGTTASGLAYVAISVTKGNKRFMDKWVGTEAENAYTRSDTLGLPYAYWVWDDAYFLYPIPDRIYIFMLKYYQYIPPMTNIAREENTLCQRWPDLLIYGATAEGFHYFQVPDKSSEWEQKWNNEFTRFIRREGKKKYTNYTPRVRLRTR